MEFPNTTVECDGCGDDLNLLGTHLVVQVKPQRQVLVVEDVISENGDEAAEQSVSLGNRRGRGVVKRFHDFECGRRWFSERKSWEPKIELHVEDEIFVPEENRTVEEIAEAEGGES